MQSKITGGSTDLLFTGKILNNYDVKYYRCKDTGFIQTEEAYWLEEAYSSAITKLDIGLLSRNEGLREIVSPIIGKKFDRSAKFLDYAGGYGVFTRLMRDRGFEFYHTDIYCQNIFAEYFDLTDLPPNTKFELVTAFEVFEHLPNPLAEMDILSELSDNILFSTVLQPKIKFNSTSDWWYFIPETGQHIALYTEESLRSVADKFGYQFFTDGISNHLFTKTDFSENPFAKSKEPFLIRKMRKALNKYEKKGNPERESLLIKDWNDIKSKITIV